MSTFDVSHCEVEAAAKSFYESVTEWPWDKASAGERAVYCVRARAALEASQAEAHAASSAIPTVPLEVRLAIAEEAASSWQSKANAAEFRANLCWNDLLAAREALEPFAVEGRKIPYEVRDDEAWEMIDFMPGDLRRAARLTEAG